MSVITRPLMTAMVPREVRKVARTLVARGEAVLAGFGRGVGGNSWLLAGDSSRALLDGSDAGPKPLTKRQTAKAISWRAMGRITSV